jgi:hypothetical protein
LQWLVMPLVRSAAMIISSRYQAQTSEAQALERLPRRLGAACRWSNHAGTACASCSSPMRERVTTNHWRSGALMTTADPHNPQGGDRPRSDPWHPCQARR